MIFLTLTDPEFDIEETFNVVENTALGGEGSEDNDIEVLNEELDEE